MGVVIGITKFVYQRVVGGFTMVASVKCYGIPWLLLRMETDLLWMVEN